MRNNLAIKSFVGELQVSYVRKKDIEFKRIENSNDVVSFIRKIFPTEKINHREYAYAIFLNRSNFILGYYLVSAGGISGTAMDAKVIFQAALLANASALIIFHNHPSSNKNSSEADRQITDKIKAVGLLLDLPLLDHLIITEKDYFSFADEGLL